VLTDRDGRLCGTFRKIHLPGTKAADGFAQVYEPSAHHRDRVREVTRVNS